MPDNEGKTGAEDTRSLFFTFYTCFVRPILDIIVFEKLPYFLFD